MKTQNLCAILLIHWMTTCSTSYVALSKKHHSSIQYHPFYSTTRSFDSESFDFSSSRRWESFYQHQPDDESVHEWHASVAPADIAQHIPDGPILMIGCGNSRLPDYFSKRNVTLLDSSPTCMDVLRKRYAQEENFDFVCGDVLALGSLFSHRHGFYSSIIDKGLMDAFLCGEDWENTVLRLMEQSSMILSGTYVLVSYRLPSSTQAYLQEAGEKYGLGRWKFHVIGSNGRVGISLVTNDR